MIDFVSDSVVCGFCSGTLKILCCIKKNSSSDKIYSFLWLAAPTNSPTLNLQVVAFLILLVFMMLVSAVWNAQAY